MLKRTLTGSYVTALAVLTVACTPAGNGANLVELARLDIQGAKSLVLAGKSTQQYRVASGAQETSLYKLNAADQLEPVLAIGNRGESLGPAAAMVQTLLPVNKDFVFVGTYWGGHLIRLTDGKAVRVSDPSYSSQPGEKPVQVDANGNLFVKSQNSLLRVQIPRPENPDQVTQTALTHDTVEEVTRFVVDRSGLVLAETRQKANPMKSSSRLYKLDGTVVPLSLYSLHEAWVGRNGKIYAGAQTLSLGADDQPVFTSVSDRVPNASNTPEWHGISFQSHAQVDDYDVFASQSGYMHPGDSSVKANLHVIKDLEHRRVPLTQLTSIDSIAAAKQTVFAIGKASGSESRLVTYDLRTETERIAFEDPDYLLLKVMANADDRPTLSALRLTDNTYVLGRLNPEGKLTILSAELPPVQQILTLE